MTITQRHFYVGTYTDVPSQSRGIARIALNTQTGEITRLEDVCELRNPSYLVNTSTGLYTFSEVSEQEGAQVVHLQPADKNGAMNCAPIHGDAPCHIAIDAAQRFVAVANYGSGNVSVHLLDENHHPSSTSTTLFIDGFGPKTHRQSSPHAHQVTFIDGQLVVVDLGSDRVHFYRHQDSLASFELDYSVALSPGSGPRHLVFNQACNLAYVVCELSETLAVLTYSQGRWSQSAEIPLLPEETVYEAASAIYLSQDERYVYVSCRKQNCLSILDVSVTPPQNIGRLDTQGQFPRDFTLSACEHWLLVANQHSNNIVSFHRDTLSDAFRPTGYECSIDAPVCLVEYQA
ncbi:lactonase family protein [Vibrio cholerae]